LTDRGYDVTVAGLGAVGEMVAVMSGGARSDYENPLFRLERFALGPGTGGAVRPA
jgi:hypothetical protein